MRYFIELAYQGTHYAGWQTQPNATTIQGLLDEKLSILLRKEVETMGSGRTDAGVHAQQQIAHFDTPETLDTAHLVSRLNSMLPYDIAVRQIFPVDSSLHARFSATRRRYRYAITLAKDPFSPLTKTHIRYPLHIDRMSQTVQHLIGRHDFTTFSKKGSNVYTHDCEIFEAKWEKLGENELVFEIEADRFLRGMVRLIVGALLEVGNGKLTPEAFLQILHSQDRTLARPAAPSQGLFLAAVTYPES